MDGFTQEQNDILEDVLGSDLLSAMDSAFECMVIAEEEIERAQELSPDADERLYNSFLALAPVGMTRHAASVYRHHARQLLELIATHGHGPHPTTAEDALRQPTDAEILLAMSEASKEHMPSRDGCCLMDRIMTDVFGDAWAEERPDTAFWPPQPTREGAVRELKYELRDTARPIANERVDAFVESYDADKVERDRA